MTLTTGVATPVAAVTGTAVTAADALRERLAHRPSRRRRPARLVATVDLLAGAIAAATVLGVGTAWSPSVLALLALAWPGVLRAAAGRAAVATDAFAPQVRALVQAGSWLALAAWVAVAVAPGAGTAPGGRGLAVSTLVLATSAPTATLLLRALVRSGSGAHALRVVLVGDAADVRGLLREARRGRASRAYHPVAVCLPEDRRTPDAEQAWPLPVWRGTDRLIDVVRDLAVDAVVVVPGSGIGHVELRRWGRWLRDQEVGLFVSTGLRDVAPERLGLARLGGARLLRVGPAALSGIAYRAKGAVDRVAAALLLATLAPWLGLLALLIRADSPGPALFRQTRVGRHGRPFTVYKLRTMRSDAPLQVDDLGAANESDRDGVLFKIRRDPRVTRLGRLLRSYSLDELPQLLNVVRGEMSLVGPRPALPAEVRGYSDDMRHRLDVKPGMTGLWQVSGRSDLSWEETVRLDLQYVDNWSWRLDALIALRTVSAVLGRRGAY